jgi:hypothetical protein
MVWYNRFHDFTMMLGIYLCPPNAMDKTSEMGKEWTSDSLPLAFHDKHVQSERILGHILRSPKFIPTKYKDELMLNPNPYNFLRLFIALHACSASDLSTVIVRRPLPMKASQSLASYAYAWLQYFTNEANVSGMSYSKYKQYAYFVDGLHTRYSPIKKFLEQDFLPQHDRENDIPISLELHNIPATIASLAKLHGISPQMNNNQVQQIQTMGHQESDIEASHTIWDSIQKLQMNKKVPTKKTAVQCWLCDGQHTFRECNQLTKLRTVCAKRPAISKYIKTMMTSNEDMDNKRISIKAVIDAYGVDQSETDQECHKDHDSNSSSIQAIIESACLTSTMDGTTGDQIVDVDIGEDCNNDGNRVKALHSDQCLEVSYNDDCYISHDDLFTPDDEHYENLYVRTMRDNYDDFIIMDQDVGDEGLHAVDDVVRDDRCCSIHTSSPPTVKLNVYHRAQVDSGADRTTTPHRELIHDFRLPDPSQGDREHIGDAGEHVHRILGYGFFHIHAEHAVTGKTILLRAPCMLIPSIPSTLVNFLDIPRCQVSGMVVDVRNDQAYQLLEVENDCKEVIRYRVPLLRMNTRLYTANRLVPSAQNSSSVQYGLHDPVIQRIISDEPTRLLWHARLGHLNYRSLSSLSSSVSGLPKIKDSHSSDNCPSCLESKLRRSPAGHGSMLDKATSYGQVLAGDWGFICMKSADESRIKRLESYYKETSYLIFTCAYSGALFGVCSSSKAVPTAWLDSFFFRLSHKLHHLKKTVLVDRGSELGRSADFQQVASRYRYHLV